MNENAFPKMSNGKPGPYEADLPTIRLLKINWELSKLREWLEECSKPQDFELDIGQCAAFKRVAREVDFIIDRCGLPAVPIDEVENEWRYFHWLMDHGYLDELTDIKVRLQRIEEKLGVGKDVEK